MKAGGHREAVKIDYDPAKVSYATLLGVFWHSVDPTDAGGQFCDRGHAYTTAIYAIGKDDLAAAEKSKQDVQKALGTEIVTEILPAPQFWPAEDYHQDYYLKNPDPLQILPLFMRPRRHRRQDLGRGGASGDRRLLIARKPSASV